MGLDHVGFRSSARFDGVGINGALPQNPMAVQKMARCSECAPAPTTNCSPMMWRFVSGSVTPSSARQKLGFGLFHAKSGRAELREKPPHVGGFAFAHQAGVDVDAVDAIRPERAQAQRVSDRGIHAAADEEKHIAIAGDGANLLLRSAGCDPSDPNPSRSRRRRRRSSTGSGGPASVCTTSG